MPEPTITKELYNSLLIAMRDGQMGYRKAADSVGCSLKIAWKAYKTGWPSIIWAKPIEKVINDDRLRARAAVAKGGTSSTKSPPDPPQLGQEVVLRRPVSEVTNSDLELARDDVLKARREEGLLVRGARSQALVLLMRASRLNAAITPLVDRAIRDIDTMVRSNVNMDVDDTLRLAAKIGVLAEQSVSLAERAVQLERSVLGPPDEATNAVGGAMTPEEALATLVGVRDTLHEATQQGMRLLENDSAPIDADDDDDE